MEHPFVGHAGRHVPVARDREVVERSQLGVGGRRVRGRVGVGQQGKERPQLKAVVLALGLGRCGVKRQLQMNVFAGVG